MSYRLITVANPAKISIKNGILIIHTDEPHSIPVEDVSVLILENQQITVTTYALSRLAEEGVCVFTCNGSHVPDGIYTPFCSHSRRPKMLWTQISASLPLRKQMWKDIVVQKIKNQALCLDFCGFIDQNDLHTMAEEVRSGDSTHVEAKAAAYYFRTLFGERFSRKQENIVNSALNYGYSIIRGVICRDLVGLGLEPSLGLFHHSELNAFNLADDIIEPFRPIVDMWTFTHIDTTEKALSRTETSGLVNLLQSTVMMKGTKQSVLYASRQMCESVSASLAKKAPALTLPQLLRPEVFIPKELRSGKETER